MTAERWKETAADPEHSGVMSLEDVGGVRLIPTVEELDELPEAVELSEETVDGMIDEARDALALLPDVHVTALILSQLCELPDEAVALVSAQALQLLGNKFERANGAVCAAQDMTVRAVESRREAEVHVLNGLGPYRNGFGK